MFNKKGATTGDILSYFIVLLFGSITVMGTAYFFVAPSMGNRAKLSVTENIAEFNDDIFLFNYLRYHIEEKTMADLVVKAYMENDKQLLKQETINFFNELYSQETRVCCRINTGMSSYICYWKEREECNNIVPIENCIQWQILINDRLFVNHLHLTVEREKIYETYIPDYYGLEPIKFKFVFY